MKKNQINSKEQSIMKIDTLVEKKTIYKVVQILQSDFNKQNKMFRQKIDDLTNCSCRLLPNQSNQYMIFKTQNSHSKVINKEPKQKFSLKSQIASSTKQQNKVTSAQKTSLKAVRLNQDEKHALSKNFNSNKQKIQKNLICSPENSQLRKINDNQIHATTFGSEVRSFTKMQNSVKTAQNNKMKVHKNGEINSQKQVYAKGQQNKNYMVSNFGNHSYVNNLHQISKKQDIPKKSLNFQDYYKYVSNPYAVSEKNKENIHNGDNPQTSRYKIDLRLKKQYRKHKNQTIPLQEVNKNLQTNVFHESLQKYDGSKQDIRGTFNGSLTTKNSMNSQNDSMKQSKNQVSLMNSNVINFNQNPSLQFSKTNSNHQNDANFMRYNQSELFSQKNLSSVISQRNKTQQSYVRSIMGTQSEYIDNGHGLQPKLIMKNVVSQIQRPSIFIQDQQRKALQMNQLLGGEKKVEMKKNELNRSSPVNRKILFEKMNSFNDIINNTQECESVLGEGERSSCSNQESVVIMRYKDLVQEVQGLSEFDHNVMLKPQDLQMNSKALQKQKDNNFLIDSCNLPTSIKPSTKHLPNLVQDSAITCNQNMKKTLKYNNQYFIHQFNLLQ